jgi:DNA processing protein
MPDKNEEKIFFNALTLACESNFSFLSSLKNRYGSFQNAWNANTLNDSNFIKFEKATIEKFFQKKKEINPESEWKKLLNLNGKLILQEDIEYPELLKETIHCPLGIYQLGEYDHQMPTVAIVGTRRCSPYGKNAAEKISRELIEAGLTVVSGLAYGIDTFAHSSALSSGGKTIAVMGTGLDNIFPSANKKLSEKIKENGCLISEYPLSTPALKHHFPERNRIISGLSLGVVVIEAPLKSGALITTRFALEQNREVFSVPGSIFSKNSEGANELIKAGAKLVNNINDILTELNLPLAIKQNSVNNENLNEVEKKIMEIFNKSEKSLNVDEIIILTNLDPATINQNLTFLELKNLIQQNANGYTLKR